MTTYCVQINTDHYICAMDTCLTIESEVSNRTEGKHKFLYHDKFILLCAGDLKKIYKFYGELCDLANKEDLRIDKVNFIKEKVERKYIGKLYIPFTSSELDFIGVVLTDSGLYSVTSAGVTFYSDVGRCIIGGSGSEYLNAYKQVCIDRKLEFNINDAICFTSNYDPYTSEHCDILHVYHKINVQQNSNIDLEKSTIWRDI